MSGLNAEIDETLGALREQLSRLAKQEGVVVRASFDFGEREGLQWTLYPEDLNFDEGVLQTLYIESSSL